MNSNAKSEASEDLNYLRVNHNGNILEGNPFWHIGIGRDGKICGEVLLDKAHFKGGVHRIESETQFIRLSVNDHLSELEVQFIFQTAAAMAKQFPPANQHLVPHHDNVCIQGNGTSAVLYRYIVPPQEQQREDIARFFEILQRTVKQAMK